MRVIAFVNQKGGVGKTTSAVSLGAAWGVMGERVLLVDLDPQASATRWLALEPEDGLLEVFSGGRTGLAELARPTCAKGVECVPAAPGLVNAETALAQVRFAEKLLQKALSRLPSDRWDLVLVDVPPTLGLLTYNALAGAIELVVPVEVSTMALAALGDLQETVRVVREEANPKLRITGILVCRYDGRTRISQEVAEHLRGEFGDLVLDTVVRETVRLKEAWSFRKPIAEYDPKGSAAADYAAVAIELLDRGEGR